LRTTLPPTRAGLRAIDEVLRKSYDVAHLHGVSFALIDILAHRLRRAGIPWVFTLHGAPRTPERLGFPMNRLYEAYLRGYGGVAMRDAAVRTAVSRAACDYPLVAPQFGDARIIHNGIFREEYAGDAREASISAWPSEFKSIVISIGRVERTKAFDVGVRALAKLPKEIAYVVLGQDCGEAKPLRELAQQLGVAARFFTLGHVDLPQKRFALRRAAACLIPSLNESFGLVALEAMASGVPVVTSGAEGLREIFTGELASCIVPGRKPDAYAALTAQLMSDPAKRAAIVEAGRSRVLDFDWCRLAQAYASAYRDAVLKQKDES
jgi:glycosyltransferase involved in cell wall biosynthesis